MQFSFHQRRKFIAFINFMYMKIVLNCFGFACAASIPPQTKPHHQQDNKMQCIIHSKNELSRVRQQSNLLTPYSFYSVQCTSLRNIKHFHEHYLSNCWQSFILIVSLQTVHLLGFHWIRRSIVFVTYEGVMFFQRFCWQGNCNMQTALTSTRTR